MKEVEATKHHRPTSKLVLSYEDLKELVIQFCDKFLKGREDYELVAIMRGGATPGHIAAKYLKKRLGVIYINSDGVRSTVRSYAGFNFDKSKTLVFIEDVITLGITYQACDGFALEHDIKDWMFVPVIIDTCNVGKFENAYPMLITDHWIQFPWTSPEDLNKPIGSGIRFRDKVDKIKT